MENIKNVIRFYNFLLVSNLIPYSTKHKSFFFSLRFFFFSNHSYLTSFKQKKTVAFQ